MFVVLSRRVPAGIAVCVLGSVVPLLSPEAAHAEVRTVNAGQSLQSALNAAQPGDHVVLAAGATFKGSFKLPAKPFGPAITVRSSATLPARRLTPSDAPLLPTLVSASSTPALSIAGTANWRVDGLRFESNANGLGTIVQIADSSSIVLDRLLIVGGAAGQKRAVQGNGRHITLTRSHIGNIWMGGQDSQAFCAWDGAGPYTITDNYLEAASENIMFGGADSKSPENLPSDILIERNFLTKRLEWKGQAKVVKNLFELKAARRVTVRHNVFERSWVDGQTGFGIAFTVRNQNGKAPWSATTDVLFEHNIVRDVDRGISILGRDGNYPSEQTSGLTIRNNLLIAKYDAIQLGGEAGTITIDHNTFVNGASFLKLYRGTVWAPGEPAKRPGLYAAASLTITNNIANHNEYGVSGDQSGLGIGAIQKLTAQYYWTHNVLAGGRSTIVYPAVTWRPTVAEHTAQFTASYALTPGSSYRGAGTDGGDLGATLPFAGAGLGEPPRAPAAPTGLVVVR